MKASIIATFTTFAAFASAAPTGDHVRRSWHGPGHNVYEHPSHTFDPPAYKPAPSGFAPTGVSPPRYNPTGVIPHYSNPTGSVPQSYPIPTGVTPPSSVPSGYASDNSSSCPVNGAVVCNGENQFGLCNWGRVIFMDVAEGTACIDGKIVGTSIYAAETPSSTPATIPNYS